MRRPAGGRDLQGGVVAGGGVGEPLLEGDERNVPVVLRRRRDASRGASRAWYLMRPGQKALLQSSSLLLRAYIFDFAEGAPSGNERAGAGSPSCAARACAQNSRAARGMAATAGEERSDPLSLYARAAGKGEMAAPGSPCRWRRA